MSFVLGLLSGIVVTCVIEFVVLIVAVCVLDKNKNK